MQITQGCIVNDGKCKIEGKLTVMKKDIGFKDGGMFKFWYLKLSWVIKEAHFQKCREASYNRRG